MEQLFIISTILESIHYKKKLSINIGKSCCSYNSELGLFCNFVYITIFEL